MDAGSGMIPIEIKSGQTLNRDYFTGLKRRIEFAGAQAITPTLVYGGSESYSHGGINDVSWAQCGGLGT